MNLQPGIGIIGCGDYLRINTPELKASTRLKVSALYDPEQGRAERFAAELGGRALASSAAVIADPTVDVVAIFVPPGVRQSVIAAAAAAGKPILTTKPLAPHVADCDTMMATVRAANVPCGVMYGRTGNTLIHALRRIFGSGEIGRLALYRQDWVHHYPEWNTWATDPARNGGPFMDAMIHNLNSARYLMARPVTRATFFRDRLAHPQLACADTESMKVDFEGGVAHLFITWAADLAVHSKDGNFREHIDLFYCVTEEGWHVTKETVDEGAVVVAKRGKERKQWPIIKPSTTIYDEFVAYLREECAWPDRLPDIADAAEDIRLIRTTEKTPGASQAI